MPTLLSVLGINPHRIGSQESFIRELSLQLAERGWEHVVCYSAPPPEPVRRFLQLPNVHIEALETITTVSWNSSLGLWKLFRRYRPTILHMHFLGFLSPYPWMARLASVQKVVFTDHGSRPASFVATRAPFWKRCAARAIDWPLSNVVCVSKFGFQTFVVRDLLPRGRVAMIYNGVDVARAREDQQERTRFRRRYGIPDAAPLVVQVSWIIPEKGIPTVLEAARLVIEQDKNVYFALVGEGNYRQEYTRLAERLGIAANVKWTGSITDPLGEGVYAAADVVCQASDWQEVFGYVIAEAMASAKPVVATRVGGIPELVRDAETGFLVNRRDFAALADRILELLRDPSARDRMGAAGQRVAETDFNVKRNVTKLIEIYGIR